MNEKINISFQNQETQIIFENAFDFLNHLDQSNFVIITDDNLYNLYKPNLCKYKTIVISNGEISKNLETFEFIIQRFIDFGVDRNYMIFGFGGGVVCDITGFIASVFYRGLDHILIPTSLIAQIDAALGGKTGINFNDSKNIIGTFKQAKQIIIDTQLLKTLPEIHIRGGFAEIIKTSVLLDRKLFDKLQLIDLKNIDQTFFDEIIIDTIKLKLEVVEKDEFDRGIRNILNFGHTFGHAIEIKYNLHHGFAVARGIQIALKLSEMICDLKIENSLKIYNLMKKFDILSKVEIDLNSVLDNLLLDKKKEDNYLKLVLLEDFEKPKIVKIEFQELSKLIENVLR